MRVSHLILTQPFGFGTFTIRILESLKLEDLVNLPRSPS